MKTVFNPDKIKAKNIEKKNIEKKKEVRKEPPLTSIVSKHLFKLYYTLTILTTND